MSTPEAMVALLLHATHLAHDLQQAALCVLTVLLAALGVVCAGLIVEARREEER